MILSLRVRWPALIGLLRNRSDKLLETTRSFTSAFDGCAKSENLQRPLILGIETSCDDTGAALVDSSGRVWGECLHSQQNIHLRYGGIIPPVAQDLHRQHIERVVQTAFQQTERFDVTDVDAIAVTNRPGLSLSLLIGLRYAKHLARAYRKPIIPVHHMEAHATMVRLTRMHDVRFPFLCLLASGGHCLLAFVRDAGDYRLLGESLDDAPGEAFDKIARRLRLRLLPEYEWMCGGQAIEMAARGAVDPERFAFPLPLARQRNCQFSFAGIKNNAKRHIEAVELQLQLSPDQVMPHYADYCAALLRSVTRHICHRTQRAIEFCERMQWFGPNEQRRIVFSGGVACNDFIFDAISEMGASFGYESARPERKHCTDNGLMIAWNGVEQWCRPGQPTVVPISGLDDIDTQPKCALGENMIAQVENESIACKWVKLQAYRAQQ